ncbi:hypothetical protein NDA14_000088 [Ustilago hordei]|nr:hypothetical protein NDA14_000088 [Ustilago hordei]
MGHSIQVGCSPLPLPIFLPCASAPTAIKASPSAWQGTSNSAWDLCIQMTCATHATSFLSSVATASATLGSPTGPVPSTTSAPVPDLGSTPDPFVMMSLLEVWLQGVSSNITSSVMDPLRHLECHVTSLVAAVSASPTPTQTATSSRPLGAPPLPTFTPAPALPVEPSLAPNNPVYKDLLRPGNLSKLCNATVANPSGEKAALSCPAGTCHGPGCSRSRRVTGSYGRSTGIEDLVEISREHGRSAVSMETMDSYGLTCKGGPSTATRRTKLKEQAQPRRGPSSRSMQMVTTQGLERQEPKELTLIKGGGAVSKESTPGHEEEEQCRRS